MGEIIQGDSLAELRKLPDCSVQMCVTSPPYWGLRDYGVDGQLGLESTPEEFVIKMVEVFREVRRVLKDDGTLWLNLGDSYAGSGKGPEGNLSAGASFRYLEKKSGGIVPNGLKPKDLIGIPWRVAFALQADGWYLRQDIIWHKPNPMPESVADRCTKAHEYLFLLSKSAKYWFDADAIKEKAERPDAVATWGGRKAIGRPLNGKATGNEGRNAVYTGAEKRNKRSVWTVPSERVSDAHFACYPQKLIEPCIAAGSRPGDVVLDPFLGSGTTGQVCERMDRDWIGIELNPEYAEIARRRTAQMGLALA